MRKFTYFDRIDRDGWPDPEELTQYFLRRQVKNSFTRAAILRQVYGQRRIVRHREGEPPCRQ